jgi:putative tryptophan/tyrosine transport system substrate-binding protein
MSYGADFNSIYTRAATYIDKILRGEKPSDLPVEQASKYDLLINLKTARALGIELPATLLARADEVIESPQGCAARAPRRRLTSQSAVTICHWTAP